MFDRQNSFAVIWWISLIIKLALAAWLPLSSDEAYYWVWGQHPQLSYFDHPPMVGWLFAIGEWLPGFGQSVRWPAILLGHASWPIWYQILKPYLDAGRMNWFLTLVLFSPLLGLGGMIVTPDLPLIFFWSLSVWIFQWALRSSSAAAYAAFGAVLGAGFCSKYHMVLFVPFALLAVAVGRQWSRLRWGKLIYTIIAGLIFSSPVWIWNLQNDLVSFRFQLEHGLKSDVWKAAWPAEYIGGQVALIFPVILYLSLQRKEPKEIRWLHVFAWGPLLFFLYTSFKAHVEANWPIIAYPAVMALALLNVRTKQHLSLLKTVLMVWVIATVAILGQVSWTWLPINEKKIKTYELKKFDQLAKNSANLNPLYAGSYQMAGALSYRQNRIVYKLGGMNRKDFFDFRAESYPSVDEFFLALEAGHPLPVWVKERGYEATVVETLDDSLQIMKVSRDAKNTDI